jgi:hypothetical protein
LSFRWKALNPPDSAGAVLVGDPALAGGMGGDGRVLVAAVIKPVEGACVVHGVSMM